MPHVELRPSRLRPFHRKSQLQRFLETVNDSIDVPSTINRLAPSDVRSGKALRAGLLATGGLAGLTAGSAGISSLRRRHEGATGDP